VAGATAHTKTVVTAVIAQTNFPEFMGPVGLAAVEVVGTVLNLQTQACSHTLMILLYGSSHPHT